MAFLSEDLLNEIKLSSFAPISQSTFATSDLLAIANKEMSLKVVSDIMSVREDFFLKTKQEALVADVDHYRVPKQAVGNSLKAVFIVDASGNERRINRIDVEQRYRYAGQTGEPQKFYLEGDEVVLCPCPATSSGYVLFSYFARPNILVETSSCAKITAIGTSGSNTVFTVDTDLSPSLSSGDEVDFLSAKSPFLLWADEVDIVSISATQIEVLTSSVVNAASVTEPQVGDYICPTGCANIPMIPIEFHPVLAEMAAVRMLRSLGDLNKVNAAKAELQEMRMEALRLIKNRVEVSPISVSGRNPLMSAFRR